MCTNFLLFIWVFTANGQNPFSEAKNKALEIHSRIAKYEETYTYTYNKSIALSEILDEKITNYNALLEAKVEEKREFEKQSDYDRRVSNKKDYYELKAELESTDWMKRV